MTSVVSSTREASLLMGNVAILKGWKLPAGNMNVTEVQQRVQESTCMLVHTWHITGSELTLKHYLREESTYCTSLSPPSWDPTQLLPSCSLFIPPSSGSTEKSQDWKRTLGTSHPGLGFSILERCSSDLSIRAPSNGESPTFPGWIAGRNSS